VRYWMMPFAAAMVLAACTPPEEIAPAGDPAVDNIVADAAHNSRNALDWWGTYAGTLPCADCAGIETVVTLSREGTYRREQRYLGKADDPFVDEGSVEWDAAGRHIRLFAGGEVLQVYQVGENRLFHLDQAGDRIGGDLAARYELVKRMSDSRLEDHAWRLVELMGEPIKASAGPSVAFVRFDPAASRIGGSSSCNRFSGSYTLGPGNRLTLGDNLLSTRMACPEGSIEADFLRMLAAIEGYAIAEGVLTLTGADAVPLARFELASEGEDSP